MFFLIPRTIRTFCLVALVSVLTGLHCMSVSRRILGNWVLQNWFYAYRRIPWKTETESRKKAESAGDDNWRYTKGHCLNPYYTVEPLYNDKLGRTEKNGRCREVAVVQRLKREWTFFCGRWREVQLYLKTILSCWKVMNFLAVVFFTTRNCPTSAKEKEKKKTESRTRHRSGWAMWYNVSFKSIHHNRIRISLFREKYK